MRVMLLGNDALIKKFATSLYRGGIEVVGVSDSAKIMNMLGQKKFDLVLVDSLIEDARPICCGIREMCGTRVAAVVRGQPPDWKKVGSLETDGYVFEGANPAELAARVRAMMRPRTLI